MFSSWDGVAISGKRSMAGPLKFSAVLADHLIEGGILANHRVDTAGR